MIKHYSQYLFKLLLALLAMSAVVMCTLAYRASTQEQQHQTVSLNRSVQATAREIELYVGGLQRVLRLFAQEQQTLLADIIANPYKLSILKQKISLHFPKHLTFAVSDPKVLSPLISKPELFGESCRANLDFHSRNDIALEPVLSLHSSESNGQQHFDVMASIGSSGPTSLSMGIVFVSFRVNDLLRLLAAGSSSTHTLFLESQQTEVANAALDNLLVPTQSQATRWGELGKKLVPDYSIPIQGTPWILHGHVNVSESTRNQKTLWIQTALGLIALLIAGFAAWWSIEQEKISRNRTRIVLQSVDAERKRIARELHDQVLSDLSHSKRLLMDLVSEYSRSNDVSDDSDDSDDRLQAIQANVDSLSDRIRTSINDLYPHTLDNLGLCKALESMAESCSQLGINCHTQLDTTVDKRLSAERKLHTYRIITELMNNALEHSGCKAISLCIEHKDNQIIMRFEDDGKGFDSATKTKEGALGLSNIESRVLALDGSSRWMDNMFELTIPVSKHVHS